MSRKILILAEIRTLPGHELTDELLGETVLKMEFTINAVQPETRVHLWPDADFAKKVKEMIRLEILGEDCKELRQQVYLMAHQYS